MKEHVNIVPAKLDLNSWFSKCASVIMGLKIIWRPFFLAPDSLLPIFDAAIRFQKVPEDLTHPALPNAVHYIISTKVRCSFWYVFREMLKTLSCSLVRDRRYKNLRDTRRHHTWTRFTLVRATTLTLFIINSSGLVLWYKESILEILILSIQFYECRIWFRWTFLMLNRSQSFKDG